MNEFLSNDCLKHVATEVGFPVKIQIPIGVMIKAAATFSKFEFLNPEDKA